MQITKEKKIVAYCRTACAMQQDSSNIEKQVLTALSYAREKGLTINQFYADNGYSGMNLERPGMQQMLKDCSAGKIQAIIMRDSDRIARDIALCLKIKFKLKKAGIKILFISGENNEEVDKFRMAMLNAATELI